MDKPLGTSEARERLPRIVQDAERGRTTYITRRGASGPVAAVVPVSVADRDTRPAPSRALPSAPGGTFAPGTDGHPSTAEHHWAGAALAGMHHHLTEVLAAATRALAVVGAARTTHAAGDLSGALDQIAASDLRRALEQLGSDEIDALLLRDALADPGPAECEVCGRALNRRRDGSGWGHIRQNPDTGQWESIVSTSHTPIARHLPPTRPDIRAGRVYDLSEEEL